MVDEIGGLARGENSKDSRVGAGSQRDDLFTLPLSLVGCIGAEEVCDELINCCRANIGS